MCPLWVRAPPLHAQVSHKEFRKAMAMFGCPITDKDFPSFAAVYDPYATGRICYTKFNKNIARLLQPLGGSVVVSQEVGRCGPHDKKVAQSRGAPVSVVHAWGLSRRGHSLLTPLPPPPPSVLRGRQALRRLWSAVSPRAPSGTSRSSWTCACATTRTGSIASGPGTSFRYDLPRPPHHTHTLRTNLGADATTDASGAALALLCRSC